MTSRHCPVWCDRDHPAFQDHCSSGWMCYIDLLSEHNSAPLEIYLEQHGREVGPRVVISQLPSGAPSIGLLPEEAVHLGNALVRLAEMTRNNSEPVNCESCATRS